MRKMLKLDHDVRTLTNTINQAVGNAELKKQKEVIKEQNQPNIENEKYLVCIEDLLNDS